MNSIKDKNNLKKTGEFGGTVGAIFFSLILLSLPVIQEIFCPHSNCSLSPQELTKFLNFSTYFNCEIFLLTIIYYIIQAILSVLPVGGQRVLIKTEEYGNLKYNVNSLFACKIVILFIAALQLFFNFQVASFLFDHLLHFWCSFAILNSLLAVFVYFRSFRIDLKFLNEKVLGCGAYSEFFMGRERQPQIFGRLNLKTFLIKIGLQSAVIVQIVLLFKGLQILPYENYPTIIVAFLIQTHYIVDAVLREEFFLTSFEVQKEGFGFMGCAGYAAYPFLTCCLLKRVVYQGVILPNTLLITLAVISNLGMWIFVKTNKQKYYLKVNPSHPSVQNLKVLETEKGRLLLDGFWGIVRKPNYFGDIIQSLAYVPFCGLYEFFIVVFQVLLVFYHRIGRDDTVCRIKYGKDWDKYCQIVKYKVVPFLY